MDIFFELYSYNPVITNLKSTKDIAIRIYPFGRKHIPPLRPNGAEELTAENNIGTFASCSCGPYPDHSAV